MSENESPSNDGEAQTADRRPDASLDADAPSSRHEHESGRSTRLPSAPDVKRSLSSGTRFIKEDTLDGVTSAIANVPGGLASGVLAGVNPVHGLYTLMVGMPIAALFSSTRKMMYDATSAMTLVAVAGMASMSPDDRLESLIVITLIAGVFQIVLGVLGLGFLTRFVSNSVMTGFLTGIAVLIILGQLWDLTGYSGEGDSKLEQSVNLFQNLSAIDPWTTIIGLGCIVGFFALDRRPIRQFKLLAVLAIATLLSQISWFDSVVLVNSLGDIPRLLPVPHLPEFERIPRLALSGVAVAVVGLLQAAGVAQRYPNDGGQDPDDSRDFTSQGIANVATGFFRGLPGGGSLSGTALNEAAGAKTRLSFFIQAFFVIALVLIFSDLLSIIPMAALAAILVYSAILAIKPSAISTVYGTGRTSTATLMVTLTATLIVPLAQAVVLGIVLAAVLYIYKSSDDVRLFEIKRDDAQRLIEVAPPDILPSNRVTVLDTYGSLFYAGARTLARQLPETEGAEHAVVVLRIRGHGDLGSTFLGVISRYAEQLKAKGGALIISGVDPVVLVRMQRSGHLTTIGARNVFVAGAAIGESSEAAVAQGEAILAEIRARSAETTD